MKIQKTLLILASLTTGANAAITSFGDSSTFDYKYEMDVNPTGQDLDGGGSANDWFSGTSNGLTAPTTIAGGFASSNQSATVPEILYRGDFGSGSSASMWRSLVSSGAASDWTFEISVRKDGGTQGSLGWFAMAFANLNESNSLRLNIEDDRISIGDGGANVTDYMVGTDFTTGLQTVRVAHDALDNAFYIWVNNTLLNADLSTAIAGSNGSSFDNNIFLGDFSSSIAGDWSVDYIRVDQSAVGTSTVVPEPSMSALLGLGCLVLSFRRRKA